ncbi:hypothetical protein H0H92_015203, partial [Tricholoma furcatifolium]
DAHRGRKKEQRTQAANLWNWLTADTAREWWECVRVWTDPKPREVKVTGRQLRESFTKRLNPPVVPPSHFDLGVRSRYAALSGLIPSRTVDHSSGLFFSSPVTEDEIAAAKRKLRDRSSKSARGIDDVSYRTIASIPNDCLAQLFNDCVTGLDALQDWLTTVLVGVLKTGKPATDPESYRLIGLESCLLKTLTLVIDARLK